MYMPDNSAAQLLPYPEVGAEKKSPEQVFAEFDRRHPVVIDSMPEVVAALQQEKQARLDALVEQQQAFWDGINASREAAEVAMATQEAAPMVEPTSQQSRWRRIGVTVLSGVAEGLGGLVRRVRTRAESTRRYDPMTVESPCDHPIAAAPEDARISPKLVSFAPGQDDQPLRPALTGIEDLLRARSTVDGLPRRPTVDPQCWSGDEEAFLKGNGPLPQGAPASPDAARAGVPVCMDRKFAGLLPSISSLDPSVRHAVLTRAQNRAKAVGQPPSTVAALGSTESAALLAQPMTAHERLNYGT